VDRLVLYWRLDRQFCRAAHPFRIAPASGPTDGWPRTLCRAYRHSQPPSRSRLSSASSMVVNRLPTSSEISSGGIPACLASVVARSARPRAKFGSDDEWCGRLSSIHLCRKFKPRTLTAKPFLVLGFVVSISAIEPPRVTSAARDYSPSRRTIQVAFVGRHNQGG